MTLELSKRIPARTETVKFEWCRKNFTVMDQKYRAIRGEMQNPMDACFWCKYKFEDGDMLALAQIKGRRNVVLCQACVSEMEGGE